MECMDTHGHNVLSAASDEDGQGEEEGEGNPRSCMLPYLPPLPRPGALERSSTLVEISAHRDASFVRSLARAQAQASKWPISGLDSRMCVRAREIWSEHRGECTGVVEWVAGSAEGRVHDQNDIARRTVMF